MVDHVFGGFRVGIVLLLVAVTFAAAQQHNQELGGPNFDRKQFVRDYREKHWPDYDSSERAADVSSKKSHQDDQQPQLDDEPPQNSQPSGGGYGGLQRPPQPAPAPQPQQHKPQSKQRPHPRRGGQQPRPKAPRAQVLHRKKMTTTEAPTPPPTPAPTPAPTRRQTPSHTPRRTPRPTPAPTPAPTPKPTPAPTRKPRPRPKPSPKPEPEHPPPKPTKRPRPKPAPASLPSGGGGVDPNDVFLDCCKARKVPDSCFSRCNFDALNKKVLTGMFLGTDACPRSAGSDLLSCAASEKDHTSCCEKSKVSSTSAGDKCLGFCNLGPRTTFQVDVELLPCWSVLENIKTCYKQDIIDTKG
uniref:Domain of unknown function DB domain-containing protein n=1 Tax=Plectus sambesii TaxID=2011161 RepID=A0A914VJM8_9BILA